MNKKVKILKKLLDWLMTLVFAIVIWAIVVAGFLIYATKMPGHSFEGLPQPLTTGEIDLSSRLRNHVHFFSMDVGERNWQNYEGLERAINYIEQQFKKAGLNVKRLPYKFQGEIFYNVEAVLKGNEPSNPAILIGAHYDSAEGSPGANDNATGVAALIELAHLLKKEKITRTIKFVSFANEEAPYFNTGKGMGSIEYIRSLKNPKASIQCMIALETIGFYSERQGSQEYPPVVSMFYPGKGNFIAFVGNISSGKLVRTLIKTFRQDSTIPSEGAVLPSFVPGVSFSDHRSFWEAGIPALMITDTAFYRDPEYHLHTDTAERLNYDQMARVVSGLSRAIFDLARNKP